ncbi:hypothetical protein V0M98_38635 (plasmid) [Pseudomonas silesiensis]|uniref:hypothetical protein n=1 Tax=Pseudomonas silesiensis TaxID=1853130 RepID=UPI0030CDED90
MSEFLDVPMGGSRRATKSHEDIVAYIDMLYKERHLIAETYCGGRVELTEQNQKRVRRLQQFRVLRPEGTREESFRLGITLNKHLDEVFQRLANYAVGSNFADQIQRLSRLVEEFGMARDEGRVDDQENYLSDFDAAAFEISEEVDALLMHARMSTDNNFANVQTYKEKLRQNEHFLTLMNKVSGTLVALQDRSFLDMLESTLAFEPLNTTYYRHIVDRLPGWRAILLDITSVLKTFLDKERKIGEAAKKIRTMALYLQKNPGYQPRDAEEYALIPDWAYLAPGITINAYPDLSRDDIRENLIETARTIPSLTAAPRKARSAGVLVHDDVVEVMEVKVTAVEAAIINFLRAANDSITPVSAREFLASTPALASIDPKISLLCLMSTIDSRRNSGARLIDGLTITRKTEAEDARSGNVQVWDICACKRA